MKVTLVSYTKDPELSIYKTWRASRCMSSLSEIVDSIDETSPVYSPKKVFSEVTRMNIPIAEFIHFIFLIENMSIVFREQLVRSRINSYWIQSMRILPLENLYDDDQYRIPDVVEGLKDSESSEDRALFDRYLAHHKEAQALYRELAVGQRFPAQDAREHLGLNTLHRGSMSINMRALIEMMSRRSCWLAVGELWHPFVRDVAAELRRELGEAAEGLLRLPCIPGDHYKSCQYHYENKQRLVGEDPLPVCPLWLANDHCRDAKKAEELWHSPEHLGKKDPGFPEKMMKQHSELWHRDLFTGEKL